MGTCTETHGAHAELWAGIISDTKHFIVGRWPSTLFPGNPVCPGSPVCPGLPRRQIQATWIPGPPLGRALPWRAIWSAVDFAWPKIHSYVPRHQDFEFIYHSSTAWPNLTNRNNINISFQKYLLQSKLMIDFHIWNFHQVNGIFCWVKKKIIHSSHQQASDKRTSGDKALISICGTTSVVPYHSSSWWENLGSVIHDKAGGLVTVIWFSHLL